MAAELWKVRFLERVVEADDRCHRIIQKIVATLQHLESPVLTANAAEGRARIHLADAATREACDDLDFVMIAAGELTVLAMHGGAAVPSQALTDVQSLRVRNLGHRHAVRKLLQAKEVAETAYVIMKMFQANLLVMGLLLDRPGLSDDVDDLIEVERVRAIDLLRHHAIWLAAGCAALAGGARADAAGGN